MLDQIEELRRVGVQGIIFESTEFPLIISQSDVQIPVFDMPSRLAVNLIQDRHAPRAPAR